jgi:sRNA-binding carbon storage regulator CsrA
MLVLARQVDESVLVTVPGRLLKSGKAIQVRVMLTELHFRKAKLGFDAPREVRVDREEVAIARDRHMRDGRLGP